MFGWRGELLGLIVRGRACVGDDGVCDGDDVDGVHGDDDGGGDVCVL